MADFAKLTYENGTRWILRPQKLYLARLEPDTSDMPRFRRGDCNDAGEVDVADAIATLDALFLGEGELTCHDACDPDDDGLIDISDPVRPLLHLFLGQEGLPYPASDCGVDLTLDGLSCESFYHCP